MISITLPSVYPAALSRALENIWANTEGDYEVIVVSPFEPTLKARRGVLWIEEDEPLGPNAAHGRAFKAASGDFVLGWVDDHLLMPAWDTHAIGLLKELETIRPTVALGLRHVEEPHVGTVFGRYYPYFPLMRRGRAALVGWLDEGGYRRGFADADLGLRVWAVGGLCCWSGRCVLRHADDQRKPLRDGEAQFEREDIERFLSRWRWRYGKGWHTATIRDFNYDVVPEKRPDLVDIATIECPDPSRFWGHGDGTAC